MELSITDLYIILGVLCGTILVSTLICAVVYCHWHRTYHLNKPQKVRGRLYFQSSSEHHHHHQVSVGKPVHKKFSLKRFFRLKPPTSQTKTDEHRDFEQKNGTYVQLNKNYQAKTKRQTSSDQQRRQPEVCQTEIDLSKSCIELVIHQDDGTIRRKKYREKKQRPLSCQVVPMREPVLSRSCSRQERPSSEYGYTLDYRKYRSYADSVSSTSKPIEATNTHQLVPLLPNHVLSNDFGLLSTHPDGMKRHFSSPVCRDNSQPVTSAAVQAAQASLAQNTSPIDSTTSSGYHSNDVEKCLSPPLPTPNEIRNLTKRITELQRQSTKRFVRYNSLPNYRLNHIPVR